MYTQITNENINTINRPYYMAMKKNASYPKKIKEALYEKEPLIILGNEELFALREILQEQEKFRKDYVCEIQNKKDKLKKSTEEIYLNKDQLKEVPIKTRKFRSLKDLLAISVAQRLNNNDLEVVVAFGPLEITMKKLDEKPEEIPNTKPVEARKLKTKKNKRQKREFIINEEEMTPKIHELLAEKIKPYNVPQNPYFLSVFLLQVFLSFLFMRVNLFIRPEPAII